MPRRARSDQARCWAGTVEVIFKEKGGGTRRNRLMAVGGVPGPIANKYTVEMVCYIAIS